MDETDEQPQAAAQQPALEQPAAQQHPVIRADHTDGAAHDGAPAQVQEPRRRAPVAVVVGGIAVGVAALVVVVGGVVGARPDDRPVTAATTARAVPPTVTAPPAPVPPPLAADALAALPLAYYDAVIPQLLDGTTVTPTNTWTTATPRQPLIALYAATTADAAPIATLGATVPTVGTATATAVWGVAPGADGGMVLVSTPSRNRTPGDGGVVDAPSATFAWARAADVTLTSIDHAIRVDNASATISIVDREGTATTSETARLGTPSDPTPATTATYMEANYVDTRIAYTQGHPIALTGAHSSLLPGYGGDAALTALHFYPDPTGSSHGCVRVSAAMTDALAALPVGTPILFS